MTEPVNLTLMRQRRAGGLCLCGTGIFARAAPDAPWRCSSCKMERPPSLSAPTPPRFALRCQCGSALFEVGLGFIACSACAAETPFDRLFEGAAS